jgi:hypothetical protein
VTGGISLAVKLRRRLVDYDLLFETMWAFEKRDLARRIAVTRQVKDIMLRTNV